MIWSPICSLFNASATLVVLMLLLPDPATAQEGNPATMERSEANATDRVFALAAARGGNAEVELGKLALERSRSDPVREFAQRMIDDHGKAGEKLTAVAKGADIRLTRRLDPEHRDRLEELGKLSGRDFDVRYLTLQLADHQKMALLLSHEIGSGQNIDLKDFAGRTLPTIFAHLEACRAVLDSVKATPK